jgi:predicted methyltransferase
VLVHTLCTLGFACVLGAACSPATPASAPASTPAGAAASTPAHGHHHGESAEHGAGFHKDFSDAERFAASFDDPARDAWQHPGEVLDQMRIPPGSIVVDLGAGTGYFSAPLSQRVGPSGKVLALDIEPKMIEFLARRAQQQNLSNVQPVLVAPDDPGLAPNSVSRVLIVNTWHHIGDRANYARKLAGALTPGGEIWIVDFTPESDLGPPAQYRLAPSQVVRELEAGGLNTVVVEPEHLPKQYLIRASR